MDSDNKTTENEKCPSLLDILDFLNIPLIMEELNNDYQIEDDVKSNVSNNISDDNSSDRSNDVSDDNSSDRSNDVSDDNSSIRSNDVSDNNSSNVSDIMNYSKSNSSESKDNNSIFSLKSIE